LRIFSNADIITRETPQAVDVLTAFCNKVADKGKGTLETVAAGNPFTVGALGPFTTHKEKMRKRSGIDSTTKSPHGTSRQPPQSSPIWLETPLPYKASPTVVVVAHHLLLLGGDSKFSKSVQIRLTLIEENLLSSIPKDKLLLVAVEMHCRGIVMGWLTANTCNQKVEEISRLEQELAEASSSLKSSLEAVLAFKSRMAQAEVELELRNMQCAEAVAQEEKEKKRVVELEKVMEEVKLENSALEANKVSVEEELDTCWENFVDVK